MAEINGASIIGARNVVSAESASRDALFARGNGHPRHGRVTEVRIAFSFNVQLEFERTRIGGICLHAPPSILAEAEPREPCHNDGCFTPFKAGVELNSRRSLAPGGFSLLVPCGSQVPLAYLDLRFRGRRLEPGASSREDFRAGSRCNGYGEVVVGHILSCSQDGDVCREVQVEPAQTYSNTRGLGVGRFEGYIIAIRLRAGSIIRSNLCSIDKSVSCLLLRGPEFGGPGRTLGRENV